MDIEFLLSQASRNNTVYILGAGASAGLVPIASGLQWSIRKRVNDFVGWDTKPHPDTIFRRHLNLSTRKLNPYNLDDMKVKHTKEEAIQLAYDCSIFPFSHILEFGPIPSQYAYFHFIPASAIIITLNSDALARYYVSHLPIIELHGSILTYEIQGQLFRISPNKIQLARKWLEEEEFDIVVSGLRAIEPIIVRPGESEKATLKPMWDSASKVFRIAEAIFIIGYSFPIYDYPVRELLTLALKGQNCPIHVIDFNAYGIAAELRELLKQSLIFAWPLDWIAFSKAVCRIADASKRFALSDLRGQGKAVLQVYDKLLG